VVAYVIGQIIIFLPVISIFFPSFFLSFFFCLHLWLLLLVMMLLLLVDGYPMQDVVMRWRGDSDTPTEAVHGVELIEIPQFTLVEYRAISTVESLATGPSVLFQIVIIVANSESNLTTGRIADAHGRFNGIRKVPSVFTPI